MHARTHARMHAHTQTHGGTHACMRIAHAHLHTRARARKHAHSLTQGPSKDGQLWAAICTLILSRSRFPDACEVWIFDGFDGFTWNFTTSDHQQRQQLEIKCEEKLAIVASSPRCRHPGPVNPWGAAAAPRMRSRRPPRSLPRCCSAAGASLQVMEWIEVARPSHQACCQPCSPAGARAGTLHHGSRQLIRSSHAAASRRARAWRPSSRPRRPPHHSDGAVSGELACGTGGRPSGAPAAQFARQKGHSRRCGSSCRFQATAPPLLAAASPPASDSDPAAAVRPKENGPATRWRPPRHGRSVACAGFASRAAAGSRPRGRGRRRARVVRWRARPESGARTAAPRAAGRGL